MENKKSIIRFQRESVVSRVLFSCEGSYLSGMVVTKHL